MHHIFYTSGSTNSSQRSLHEEAGTQTIFENPESKSGNSISGWGDIRIPVDLRQRHALHGDGKEYKCNVVGEVGWNELCMQDDSVRLPVYSFGDPARLDELTHMKMPYVGSLENKQLAIVSTISLTIKVPPHVINFPICWDDWGLL
jgi:hypothetical protein